MITPYVSFYHVLYGWILKSVGLEDNPYDLFVPLVIGCDIQLIGEHCCRRSSSAWHQLVIILLRCRNSSKMILQTNATRARGAFANRRDHLWPLYAHKSQTNLAKLKMNDISLNKLSSANSFFSLCDVCYEVKFDFRSISSSLFLYVAKICLKKQTTIGHCTVLCLVGHRVDWTTTIESSRPAQWTSIFRCLFIYINIHI